MKNIVNRRNFLKAGGLAASGLALGLPGMSWSNPLSKNDVINIGVIGTGSRGGGLIRVMKDIPQIRVMACCDILPFHLENGMKNADPKAKAYDNYMALLEDKKLDAVLVSVPLYLHSKIAIDALDAGKHVYSEKTMAYSVDQAFQMVDKVKASPKQTFQVGHQYHSSRLYYQVVDTIKKGYIGKITGVECQWNRNGDWRRPVPEPKDKYERLINWRMYRDYSCGLLAELSSHQIDFVNWFTDAHPLSVVGTGGIDYWKDGRETYDNIHAIFDYPDGLKATFTCLTANAYEGYQIKVQGDKATVVILPTSAMIYPEETLKKEMGLVDGVSGATMPSMSKEGGIPVKGDNDDPSGQALIDFADNIINNKQPLSNVFTGAKATFAVRMALTSMMENKRQVWQDSYNLS